MWDKLSMRQKSELMSFYLKDGISSLDKMKEHYNSFQEGGNLNVVKPNPFDVGNYTLPSIPVVPMNQPNPVEVVIKPSDNVFKLNPYQTRFDTVRESVDTPVIRRNNEIIGNTVINMAGKDTYQKPKEVINAQKIGTTPDQIKATQMKLLKSNSYNSRLIDLNTANVSDIQAKLSSAGYDMSTSRKKNGTFDNVMGKDTQQALEQYNQDIINTEVDGIAGSKTKKAFTAYMKDNINIKNFNTTREQDAIINSNPYNTVTDFKLGEQKYFIDSPFNKSEGTDAKTPNCTEFINNKLDERGINRDKIGAVGNAWTIGDNIISKGGKELFSTNYQKPKQFNVGEIKSRIEESLKNKPDISIFKPGEYVELYYPSSTHYKEAFEEGGKSMTTHAGMITKDENGNLFVEHNIGGKINKDPLKDMINGKTYSRITRVVEPAYGDIKETKSSYTDATNLGIKFNKKSKGENIAGEDAYLYQKTILQNKDQIKTNFGLDDADFKLVNQIAYGVAANESYFGNAKGYRDKQEPTQLLADFSKSQKGSNIIKQINQAATYGKVGRTISNYLDKKDISNYDMSSGWGQVKEEELFGKDYVNKTGLEKLNTDTPEYSALTTISSIAAKYKVLSSMISELGVDIKPKEFKALLATSHNQGFANIKKNLEEYKETGDYSKIEQYDNFQYPKGVRRYSEEYVTFQ